MIPAHDMLKDEPHTQLRFAALVEGITAGARFTDGRPRITLRLDGVESPWNVLVFPMPEADVLSDYRIDQPFEICISSVEAREEEGR